MKNNDLTKNPEKTKVKKQSTGLFIVSLSVVLIHFMVLVAFMELTNVYTVWANILAFFVAFCMSLAGYFTLTFNSDTKKGEWFKKLFKLLAMLAIGFLLHQTLFVTGIETFGDKGYIFIWCGAMAIVVALIVVFVKGLTFIMGKLRGLNNPES